MTATHAAFENGGHRETVMIRNFLLHGSNALLLLAALIIAGFALAGVYPLFPLWIVAGAALFYLSEYSTHRFLFHAAPSSWGWVRALQHRLHYDHHIDPNRLDLLFLPAWFLIPNLSLTFLIGWAVGGSWPLGLSLVLGGMLGLIHYEWVHYIAHIPYRPLTRFGRWMKKYHLWHHYKNEHFWFGVSNPMMDVINRTYKEPEAVPRSTTVKVLHPEI
jgi:4-hydroxysphinganine ceramide fatty acyl 2-hydroxylase